MTDSYVASASVRPELKSLEDLRAWMQQNAPHSRYRVFDELLHEATLAIQTARHLRVAQIIYDDGPDESDKHQADLHMSAAILLAKGLVPWGETVVTDADAHRVINAAPASLKTGGRDV